MLKVYNLYQEKWWESWVSGAVTSRKGGHATVHMLSCNAAIRSVCSPLVCCMRVCDDVFFILPFSVFYWPCLNLPLHLSWSHNRYENNFISGGMGWRKGCILPWSIQSYCRHPFWASIKQPGVEFYAGICEPKLVSTMSLRASSSTTTNKTDYPPSLKEKWALA